LLTVVKVLDDNTYTNKTWAEVSHLQVTDIHVMEVEFLSNMRYQLLVSAEAWDQWLVDIASIIRYCQRARDPIEDVSSASNLLRGSPLPSPNRPPTISPVSALPPLAHAPQQYPTPVYSNHAMSGSALAPPRPLYNIHAAATAGSSPHQLRPSPPQLSRKRSMRDDDDDDDDDYDEEIDRPAKRVARSMQVGNAEHPHYHHTEQQHRPQLLQPLQPHPQQQQYHVSQYSPAYPAHSQQPARLAVPQRIQTLEPAHAPAGAPSGARGLVTMPLLPPMQDIEPALPRMMQGSRAMASVYHSAPGQMMMPQQQHLPMSVAPASVAQAPYPTHNGSSGYRTPTRRHSPPGLGAYASSPRAQYVAMPPYHTPAGHGSSTHSPVYLQNRASPYGPIRHVDTLLNPSFSGPVADYTPPQLPPSQMHYRSVARRNDVRTGVVPDFAHVGQYPRSAQ
jgi:hypothetical protein